MSPPYTSLRILTRDQPDSNYPYPDCTYEELNAGERVCSLEWLLLKTEVAMTEICAVLTYTPVFHYDFEKVNVVNMHYATPGHFPEDSLPNSPSAKWGHIKDNLICLPP